MKCKITKELLLEYLDGNLSKDQHEMVDKHLQECAECQAECDSLRDSWEMLGDYDAPEISDQFTRQVLQKVHEKKGSVSEGSLLSRLLALLSPRNFSTMPALASLAILAGVGYFLLAGRPTGIVEQKKPAGGQRVEIVRNLDDEAIIRDLEIYENAEILENLDLLVDLEAVENFDADD
ncbi:MAG: hypothetical protein A2W80_08815 [Candidatus Riflebacteria bacterium GWC2_50_8]|nr:MAG: hypothetical protein A2W80_08815 [Candidatus Riflebacteria bacterium GWC2_50_8]